MTSSPEILINPAFMYAGIMRRLSPPCQFLRKFTFEGTAVSRGTASGDLHLPSGYMQNPQLTGKIFVEITGRILLEIRTVPQ